jgi:hypothetical protein
MTSFVDASAAHIKDTAAHIKDSRRPNDKGNSEYIDDGQSFISVPDLSLPESFSDPLSRSGTHRFSGMSKFSKEDIPVIDEVSAAIQRDPSRMQGGPAVRMNTTYGEGPFTGISAAMRSDPAESVYDRDFDSAGDFDSAVDFDSAGRRRQSQGNRSN